MRFHPVSLALTLLVSVPAFSDGGMWTFHDFPQQLVKSKYGVDISAAWLDRVRTATIRLSNCTASFVSANGLILTNHHCAEGCLDEHSTAERNLLHDGFLARTREQELRCGTQIADVLMATQNVTAQVSAALQGLDEKAANDKRKQTLTQLEQQCEEDSRHGKLGPLKCESVDLYQGGQYWLYKYHRYDDVRLVFAPERGIAAFGGDPDNFQFPRWCLDMSVLRAYAPGGKPAATPNFLSMRPQGPDAGEVVFVSGHPGTTDRLLTVAQLESLRNVDLPRWLLRASELRGRFIQFGKTGAEAARIVDDPLNSLENSIKVRRGQLDALLDERLLQAKRAEEKALRDRVAADPQLAVQTGDPWADIARAQAHEHELYLPYTFLEPGAGFNSRLFVYARTLVRAAAERARPNTQRLREYRDAALPRVQQRLLAPVPVYPELDKLTLSFGLERMREWLGPDDPGVRRLLSKESPHQLVQRVVPGPKIGDPAVRLAVSDQPQGRRPIMESVKLQTAVASSAADAKDKSFPTGETDYPTGGTDYPTGGTDYPTGGTDYPTGGTDYPTGGTDYPTGGTDYPTSGVDYGIGLDVASLKQAQARLTVALQQLADKLGQTLESTFDNATSLEVSTYVSDDLNAVTYDNHKFGGNAKLRALTRLSLEGDALLCVPSDGTQLDEALWRVHLDMVKQAQVNRNELIKAVVGAAAGLLDALKGA